MFARRIGICLSQLGLEEVSWTIERRAQDFAGERAGTHDGLTYNDLLRTGPGTLAGRYLRSFWQPVYRSQDLPAGKAKPIRIMSEDFTLYRGAGGKAHVVASRCPHRGARLVLGWIEGEDLRSRLSRLEIRGLRSMHRAAGGTAPFCDTVSVRTYPTFEYLGMIFVYFGEGAPPPAPSLAEYEAEGYLKELRVVIWPANYFAQLENALDVVHTKFLHWQFNYKIPQNLVAEETDFGLSIANSRSFPAPRPATTPASS